MAKTTRPRTTPRQAAQEAEPVKAADPSATNGTAPAANMSLNELIADAEASARRGVPVDWRQMTYTAVNLANNYVTMMQNQMAAARNNPEAAK